MEYTGGDIVEIAYTHPTVGNGTLYAKSNEDATFDLGGFTEEDDASLITGDGRPIFKKSRKRWVVELGPIAWDVMEENELSKLQNIQNSPEPANWTIEHITGAIYAGVGQIVGDLTGNSMAATMTVKLSGGGKLEKQ